MNGIRHNVLRALLDFMYLGEVRIIQDDLEGFLSLADQFKIRGVTKDAELSQSEALKHSLEMLNERPPKQHKRSRHSTIVSSGGEEIVETMPQQQQQQEHHQHNQSQQHHHLQQQQQQQQGKVIENVEPKIERPDISDDTSCHPEFAHNNSGSTFATAESNAIAAATQSQRMFVLNPGEYIN